MAAPVLLDTDGEPTASPPLNCVVVTEVVVVYWIFCPGANGQVVVVKLLPELAVAAVQDCVSDGPVVTVLHVVSTKLFPDAAVAGVQDATGVGPVLFNEHVVFVKLFSALATAAVHVPGATAVGPVVTVLQVVVVKLLLLDAAAAEHDATGTLVVTAGAGQVICTQLLPAAAV